MDFFDRFGNYVGRVWEFPENDGMLGLILIGLVAYAIKLAIIVILIPIWVPILILIALYQWGRGGEFPLGSVILCFVLLGMYVGVFVLDYYFNGSRIINVAEYVLFILERLIFTLRQG